MRYFFSAFILMAGTHLATGDTPHYADTMNLMTYTDVDTTAHVVRSQADWKIRKAHLIGNMEKVIGVRPDGEVAPALAMEVLAEKDGGAYVRKHISFAVESWDRLSAYLLLPKGYTKAGRPAVLCLHPTYVDGKDITVGISGKAHRNYAQELAERGYVTLAPDYPGFGEAVEARKKLYEKGYLSCTRKAIWNHRCCVDLLRSLPEVDGTKIGCIGHSLGGHNTLFAGLFDERIQVMVTSCGFTRFAKYKGGDLRGWAHDGYMPRIISEYQADPAKMPFDFTEILGGLAPRPVFINAPTHDDNFELSGVRDCVQAAQPVYALFDASAALVAHYPDADHDFPDAIREKAYAFIDAALRE